ncbi:MAG: cation transporter, partial [Thermaurantiacus tibetensis]
GFWHLEPLVIGLKASLLLLAVGYALAASVAAILRGGYLPDFGLGLAYAAAVALICFVMWGWMRREAERIDSGLVRLDVTAWLMSGLITATLLAAFATALLVEGTPLQWLAPYADPAILAVLALLLLPMPLGEARAAFLEIFAVVPPALDEAVRSAVGRVVEGRGFPAFETHIEKSGRALFVEVVLLAPPDMAPTVGEVDRLRTAMDAAVADATGVARADLWLTLELTADPQQL